jgi:hypothetical protein
MEVFDGESGCLAQALLQHRFRAIDEFESFVTFARDDDPVKIHVAPDRAFAAFDDKDEPITEGEGVGDFYRALCQQ